MTRRFPLIVALIATTGLPALGSAADVASAKSDADMRCEAKQLQKQSKYFDCVARCDRLASKGTDCQQRCQDRYDRGMQGLEVRPPCLQPICVPVPEKCEARLLHAQAIEMMCLARCKQKEQRDAADPTCQSDCSTGYGTAKDEIMALCICKDGRAPAVDFSH